MGNDKHVNIKKFSDWIVEHRNANDWQGKIRDRQLNRTKIADDCVFSRSTFGSNSTVTYMLAELEAELRASRILPEKTKSTAKKAASRRSSQSNSKDKERIKSLEQQNATLRANVNSLKDSLQRYDLFDKHLHDTGRLIKP